MSADTARLGFRPRPLPPARLERRAEPALGPTAARALAVAGLAVYGCVRWSGLVTPGGSGRLLLAAALGAVAALATSHPRLGGRLALARAVLVGLVLLVLLLLAAGVRSKFVQPSGLGTLGNGLEQGITSLPGADVPYRGIDPWPRIVILLGGELLVAAGIVSGLRGGGGVPRRLVAGAPLIVLVAVPMIVLASGRAVLQGVLLFTLLAGFLWLERLPRPELLSALALGLVAAIVGAAVTPSLERGKPWIDYEALAESLAHAHSETFDWGQRYGPIDWPRTSKEVLRVQAPAKTYVKAENLDGFDGLRWTRTTEVISAADSQLPQNAPRRWFQTTKVTVRSMTSSDLLASGTTLGVSKLDRTITAAASPGTYVVRKQLGRGDSYAVTSYYPRPTTAALRRAGDSYPGWSAFYLEINLPARARRGWVPGPETVLFAPWGQPAAPVVSFPTQGPEPVARSAAPIVRSPYGEMWSISQRLLSTSRTAEDYALKVKTYLAGFHYDEDPPRASVPLASFFDETRAGYCQQFAGAMALMLRMGGVPARVSTGFSPGTYDRERGDWVIRDYDAHAWVEAWFPKAGWVTFDPTPVVAPALDGPTAALKRHVAVGNPDIPRRPGGQHAVTVAPGHAGHGWLWATIAGALALLAAIVVYVRIRRRPVPTDPVLAELERALRLTGRPPEPRLTLSQLERRLRTSPEAAAYVGALRSARYGFGPVAVSEAQRRALRDELGRGLGLPGRVRALWALPPRPALRRR